MTDGVRISQPKPSLRARSTDGSNGARTAAKRGVIDEEIRTAALESEASSVAEPPG